MTTIQIKGMSCPHCANSVQKALTAISGIDHIQIDLAKGEATFDGQADIQVLTEAISKIGFEVLSIHH